MRKMKCKIKTRSGTPRGRPAEHPVRLAVCLMLGCCMALLSCSFRVRASGEQEAPAFDYAAQYEASGAPALFDLLPEETRREMEAIGVGGGGEAPMTSLDAGAVVRSLLHLAGEEMRTLLASAGCMLAVLLLASFFKSSSQMQDSAFTAPVGMVASASVALTLSAPVVSLLQQAAGCIETAGTFTEAFGAVFVGILLANGQPAAAAGGSTFLLGAAETATVGVNGMVLPMLRLLAALSCMASVSEEVRLDALLRFFEDNAKWLLRFFGVVLTGVLGVSGILTASSDSVASRTARFVLSGSVPVVGSTVSDAYLALRSGLCMLRNSVGAFGIIAVAYLFAPLLIRTALWRLVAGAGRAVCDALELGGTQKLMSALSSLLSLLQAVLVFSLLLLTLGSLAILLQNPL